MAYPDDKETFRRVVNQDLTQGIPGDTVDENDQNLPADFLERLQDIFGYNLLGGFDTLKLRLDNIDSKFILKYHSIDGTYAQTITGGTFPYTNFADIIPIAAGNTVITKLSGILLTTTANGGCEIAINYKIDTGPWKSLGTDLYCNSISNAKYEPFCFSSEKIDITTGSTIIFRCVGISGLGDGYIKQICLETFVI